MEEVSNFCPAIAVPMTVKMPEPMTAPMPSAGQRPRTKGLLQPMFRLLRLGDQLVNGLAREELVRQVMLPGVLESVPQNSNRKQGEGKCRDFTTETRSTRKNSSQRGTEI